MRKNLAEKLSTETQAVSLVNQIINACADAKGNDIKVLDVSAVFGLSDFFIIASGRSDRHVQGIANKVVSAMSDSGCDPLAVEGLDEGHWVLLDFGDVVMHVFYEPLREHYDIEGLWGNAKELKIKSRKSTRGINLKVA